MSGGQQDEVGIRPWGEGDFWLIERLLGDPVMTEHLGGPESAEKLRDRHKRYCRIGDSGTGRMFVIVVGSERAAAGSVGYWERVEQDGAVWETGWSVLPEFQGRGLATLGTAAAMDQARAEGKHRFVHAYPSVDNGPSNGICRKLGFRLVGELEFEYPPGSLMRCNDWCLDLEAGAKVGAGVPLD